MKSWLARISIPALLILALCIPMAFAASSPQPEARAGISIIPATSPLTAAQLGVYSAFLNAYIGSDPGAVNLGDRTYPLAPGVIEDMAACIPGTRWKETGSAVDRLGGDFVDLSDGLAIVDNQKQQKRLRKRDVSKAVRRGESPADALREALSVSLLEVSQIAFDASGRYAVMSYRYSCGALCGHSGVMLFRQSGAGWNPAPRSCSGTGS